MLNISDWPIIMIGAITQALGRISEVPIKVGEVKCKMTFMVVDTDSYDILLGLDLLIKIGAIVDVEQGLIQVWRGPGRMWKCCHLPW